MTAEPRYFFLIGAMKAGTTSLYNYLADHPELYASPRKEPRVFRDPADPGTLRHAFFPLFEGRRHESWCFEGSTAYTKYPKFSGVPQRLRSVVPDARFIYLVRDPAERVWSQYVHNLAQGRESRSFTRAVAEEPQYLNISRYHRQLVQYLNVFPKENILVQIFEEMVKDPATTVRTVCEFLGVDSSFRPPSTDVAFNRSDEKLAAPAALRMMRSLRIHDRVPWSVRHRVKAYGAPLPAKAIGMPTDARTRIVEALREDTEAFFAYVEHRVESWTNFA